MAETLIRVTGLEKTFRQGFWMRRVDAVRGISFRVERGAIFGFLGPNGAGKTTTIKVLTGLIRMTRGEASIFDHSVSDPRARRHVGFLPENPYIYPYLTPLEFVRLCGKLSGVPSRELERRAREVLERVGMSAAMDRPVRRLSKGMLQRTGLAAALVGDPELLILDEPMSGLDPVGRRDVRELILEERRRGRTIFFSSHILSDVETLCDRVAILREGRVVEEGRLDALLHREVESIEVVLGACSREEQERTLARFPAAVAVSDRMVIVVESRAEKDEVLRYALEQGQSVLELGRRQDTLEDLFMRHNIGTGESEKAS